MPLEQIANSLVFLAFFTESKIGKTGLTVTTDVFKSDGTQIVTGGSAVAVGGGLYRYTLASGSNDVEELYTCIFKTATLTVDQRDIPALWCVQKAGVENLNATVSSRAPGTDTSALIASLVTAQTDLTTLIGRLTSNRAGFLDAIPTRAPESDTDAILADLVTVLGRLTAQRATNLDNLDATVSTRLATAGYTVPPTAAANADAVWDEILSTHAIFGSTGWALEVIGGAADTPQVIAMAVWNEPSGDHLDVGSTGAKLALIGTGTANVTAPVSTDGTTVSTKQGHAYAFSDGLALQWSVTGYPSFVGGSVAIRIQTPVTVTTLTGEVISATTLRVELTAAQTAAIASGTWAFDIDVTLASTRVVTPVTGKWISKLQV